MTELHSSILYVPDLIVWHHRRSGLLKHLQQISIRQTPRLFCKNKPENSRKFQYFVQHFLCILHLHCSNSDCASRQFEFLIPGWLAYTFALVKAWSDIQRHEGRGWLPWQHSTFQLHILFMAYILLSESVPGPFRAN